MRLGRIGFYDEAGFDTAAASGLEFLEICCNFDNKAEAFVAAESSVKFNIARTGIDVSSVGRWNHTLQSGGAIDKKQLDGYFRLLDAAVNVGAKTFVCGINYDDSISLYKNYANAIR